MGDWGWCGCEMLTQVAGVVRLPLGDVARLARDGLLGSGLVDPPDGLGNGAANVV